VTGQDFPIHKNRT